MIVISIDEKIKTVIPIDQEKQQKIIDKSIKIVSSKAKTILGLIIAFILGALQLAYDNLGTNQQASFFFICCAVFGLGLFFALSSLFITKGLLTKKDIANAKFQEQLIIKVKEIILDDRKESNTQIGKVMDHTAETIKAITVTFNQAILKLQSGELEEIDVEVPGVFEEVRKGLTNIIDDSFKPLKPLRDLDTKHKRKPLTDNRSILDKI